MRLTAFTDYSLRVLMVLAADPTRLATIASIAESFGVSENHLVKVVHFLGRQGWIETVRGKGGGIRLKMPPQQVNIGRVVRDTEGAAMPAECFGDGKACALDRSCRLKGVLGEAVQAFEATLERYTLADLVQSRRTVARLVEIRSAAPPR